MNFLRKLRAVAALLCLAIPLLVVAGPALYLVVLWDRLLGVDGTAHRRRISRWQEICGLAALAVVSRIMGIKVVFDLPPPPVPRPSYIVIANHFGGFDGFLITKVLVMLAGRAEIRAIGKREVASWPVVGLAWRELRWGFVARNRDPKDYEAVERCGKDAFVDGACALIFPEGTTYHPDKTKHGYALVLPPKSGGLQTLLKAMPGAPVLSVTIRWGRERYGQALVEGGVPLGRKVEVSARFVEVDRANVTQWLRDEWRRKEEAIAAE